MNKKLKILIAEDERAIAGALNLKLNHVGFDSSVAFNGREAMDNLQKEKYDLLILDLIMPQLDGFGVLAEIKEKGIKIPVIVASNLSQTEDINKAKELGAVDFFIKSDTPVAEIVEKIKKYFNL
ncbi:MAG: response regulator [Candidatus Staskawiczbacteria bacterium]